MRRQLSHALELAVTIEYDAVHIISARLPSVNCDRATLKELRDIWLDYLPRLERRTRAALSKQEELTRLVRHFPFPSTVSVACQQYLAYFTQFLADLGIDSDSEIHHTAVDVLFKVTPRGGPEALEQIREALDLYLQLPMAPTPDMSSSASAGVAAMQLLANIDHLKGQVRLAIAEVGLYRAQLEAKDVTIETVRRSLAPAPSAPPTSAAKTPDPEPLLDGTVSLGKFEKGGVAVHWGEILRRLKRRRSESDWIRLLPPATDEPKGGDR